MNQPALESGIAKVYLSGFLIDSIHSKAKGHKSTTYMYNAGFLSTQDDDIQTWPILRALNGEMSAR